MTGWLLDTNVLSELRRLRPEPKVLAFVAAERLADLTDWLTHTLRPMFAQRVLPVSEDVMLRWRLMVEAGRKAGHTFSQPDLIIAATAAQHGLTVVSRDTTEYRRAGVGVLDPWTEHQPA